MNGVLVFVVQTTRADGEPGPQLYYTRPCPDEPDEALEVARYNGLQGYLHQLHRATGRSYEIVWWGRREEFSKLVEHAAAACPF